MTDPVPGDRPVRAIFVDGIGYLRYDDVCQFLEHQIAVNPPHSGYRVLLSEVRRWRSPEPRPDDQAERDKLHRDELHRAIHDALCVCDFGDDCEFKTSYRDAADEVMAIRDADIVERDAEITRLRAEIDSMRAANQ